MLHHERRKAQAFQGSPKSRNGRRWMVTAADRETGDLVYRVVRDAWGRPLGFEGACRVAVRFLGDNPGAGLVVRVRMMVES